jgi:hypothetical protein
MNNQIKWAPVVARAKQIVESFATPITLRRLFYLLVSEPDGSPGKIPNRAKVYSGLSDKTAKARRNGDFPELLDLTCKLYQETGWLSPASLINAAAHQYKRDRTEGQPYQIYVGVEKNGLRPTLQGWFDEYSVKVFAVGGYESVTFESDVNDAIMNDDRPAVLLYGGDLDPSGVDIFRNFKRYTGPWEHTERVAITWEQTEENNIPRSPFAKNDSRNDSFLEEYGALFQVEIDALDALAPGKMQEFYMDAFMKYWDDTAFEAVLTREESERERLTEFAGTFEAEEPDEDDE